jgi:hypothetical protein
VGGNPAHPSPPHFAKLLKPTMGAVFGECAATVTLAWNKGSRPGVKTPHNPWLHHRQPLQVVARGCGTEKARAAPLAVTRINSEGLLSVSTYCQCSVPQAAASAAAASGPPWVRDWRQLPASGC